MKGFGIEIKNNLLDPKHVKAMGDRSSVWEYMWCIDKMTKIDDDGLGYVLGGKPIKRSEIANELGKDIGSISKNLQKLVEGGYINLERTGYGNIITINKAKKRFRDNATSDVGITPHQKFYNATSNKTIQKRQYSNILISKDINTASSGFGNPQINELSKYLLSVMNIPKEDCTQPQSRRYWSLLLKESKTGIDGVKWLVDLAGQDKFYRDNISSSKDLYYKRVKLIQRKRGSAPKIMM